VRIGRTLYTISILLAHAEYAGGTPDVRYSYAGISKDFCAYENYFINFHTLLIRFSHTRWCDRALRKPARFFAIAPSSSPVPLAFSLGPGTHGTGSARKRAVVSKMHSLELGRFNTRNNFHSEVLRRNEVFVLTYLG
jgi:hypothetical protein